MEACDHPEAKIPLAGSTLDQAALKGLVTKNGTAGCQAAANCIRLVGACK